MPKTQPISTDWDVEQYRNEWENDAQWNLREQFMLAYKDTIPEDKLVCWAQVYGNIETYNCRYPVEVMDQIEKLAAKLNAGRQQHVKGRESYIVFQKEGNNDKVTTTNNTGSEKRLDNRKRKATCSKEENGQDVCNTKFLNGRIKLSDIKSGAQTLTTPSFTAQKVIPLGFQEDSDVNNHQNLTRFKNFVIMINENVVNPGVENVFHQCAAFNKMVCRFTNTTISHYDKRCVIELNDVVVGEGTDCVVKEAKRQAAKSALMNLSQVAHTLIVKVNTDDPDKRLTKKSLGVVPVEEEKCIGDVAISESNVGHKLLRLMGWSGGGLGRTGNEGITEPIKATTKKWSRKGLGLPESNDVNQFRSRITAVLREFSNTSIDNELVFSAEFSKEERMTIHQVCTRFKLKSSSTGNAKKGGRYLTIRHMSHQKLKWHALLHGGLSDKYEVLPPGSSWPRIKEILKFD